MRTSKGYRCSAEIGRPGNLHGCMRKAHYRAVGKFGVNLHYCEAHKDRASKPQPLIQ